MHRRWHLLLTCLTLLLVRSPEAAARGAPPYDLSQRGSFEAPCDQPLLVVISGGVSRGSYQAGQMYVLSNHLRERQQQCHTEGTSLEVTVVGSSAGSINALLLAIDLMTNTTPPWSEAPEETLFARTWLPLGFSAGPDSLDAMDKLEEDPDRIQQALIDVQHLRGVARALDAYARGGLPPSSPAAHTEVVQEACRLNNVRLAVTTARHTPTSDNDGVMMDVTQSFGFELRRGDDGEVKALPLEDRCDAPDGQPCEAEQRYRSIAEAREEVPRHHAQRPDGSLPVEELAMLAVASSSIPVAFPLFKMTCDDFKALSPSHPDRCHQVEGIYQTWVHSAEQFPLWFMDGGTLEGNPLRVGEAYARRSPRSTPPDFFYLDPDLMGLPIPSARVRPEMWQRYLQILGAQGAHTSLLTAMRNQSITLLLADDPATLKRASFIQTNTAPFGNLVGNFLAFYDRSFRIWDLFAGVQDAFAGVYPEGSTRAPPPSSLYGLWRESRTSAGLAMRAEPPAQLRALVDMPVLQVSGAPTTAAAGWGGELGTPEQLWSNLMFLSAIQQMAELSRDECEVEAAATGSGTSAWLRRMVAPAPLKLPDAEGELKDEDLRHMDERREALLVAHSTCKGWGFAPLDLGEDPLHEALRGHMNWQLRQLKRREALTSSPVVRSAATLAQQALLGGSTYNLVSVATPLHNHRLPAPMVGMGWEGWQAGEWIWPVDVQLGADIPHPDYRLSETDWKKWEWATSLDVRAGVAWGPRAAGDTLGVGPHHRFTVGAQLVLRGHLEGRCEGEDDPLLAEGLPTVTEGIYCGRPGWSTRWGPEDAHCAALVPGLGLRFTAYDLIHLDAITFPAPMFGTLAGSEPAILHLQMGVAFPVRQGQEVWRGGPRGRW